MLSITTAGCFKYYVGSSCFGNHTNTTSKLFNLYILHLPSKSKIFHLPFSYFFSIFFTIISIIIA
nr:MAG TPA: hypothetical protein [Caudoviricetes sp.]